MSDVQEQTVSASTELNEDKLLTEQQEPKFHEDSHEAVSSTSLGGVEDVKDDGNNIADTIDSFDSNIKPAKVDSTAETNAVERESSKSIEKTPNDEDITLKSPLAHWMIRQNFSPTVIDLLYWKKWQQTAGIFLGMLILLFSLQCYPFISVVTMFGLALLIVAFLYRIGMAIVNAVQKTSAEHPFKNLLEEKIELSEETVRTVSENTRNFVNGEIKCLQKLFLIEDLFQSAKFALTLWLVSYIGHWFSLLTLSILFVICLFTIPKLYEEKQKEIDNAFLLAQSKFTEMTTQIEQKLPEKLKKYIGKDKKE